MTIINGKISIRGVIAKIVDAKVGILHGSTESFVFIGTHTNTLDRVPLWWKICPLRREINSRLSLFSRTNFKVVATLFLFNFFFVFWRFLLHFLLHLFLFDFFFLYFNFSLFLVFWFFFLRLFPTLFFFTLLLPFFFLLLFLLLLLLLLHLHTLILHLLLHNIFFISHINQKPLSLSHSLSLSLSLSLLFLLLFSSCSLLCSSL
mmetsp:Transcript_12309/g.18784  ORF Transcript_12309/g.18784 Transcript_12309/m.18784 type:complete len:204 (-) Transcript_12309:125-736(-)